ncbi:hydrogenase maturation nickel metallochaperone HypA [Streptomyces sp. NBC_01216]|uniref:hydrogenase maturation nickel metallochaperone HypA/HybF n=1 Tax=unclassified Streptomyces TaxID=2593676 RepID=UPI002E0FF7F6|nr:hydrogenase maturation nickel metallochaperone HypA [Streptomyces sp. NBC_01216]
MHEMSIAMAVVAQVEEAARSDGASAVTRVDLQVGELAGVVPDALAFSFGLACAGTVLEGAELVTRTEQARARCASCAYEWSVGMPPELRCTRCGEAADVRLLAGRELRILSVTWEDDAAEPVAPLTREPIPEEA